MNESVDSRANETQLSMVLAVQKHLPDTEPRERIAANVREALRTESRANELALAWMRAPAVLALALLELVLWARPALASLPRFPLANGMFALGWAAIFTALLLRLRAGWYRSWLRYGIPAADGLLIWLSFLMLWISLRVGRQPVPQGVVAILATVCVFLSFSGSLRLSRSSGRLTAVLAIVIFAFVGIVAGMQWLQLAVVLVILAATGVLSTRITSIIRRVVTTEVGRMQLQRMYSDAQEDINAREEVLKIISHDLRNPLGTIAMTTDLLLEMQTTEEQRVGHLRVIKRTGERMGTLIHDLLDVVRMEAGRLAIEPRRMSVAAVLRDVSESMRPLAAAKKLELETQAPESAPPLRADHERVMQVFSNLVGNAIKFTPAGGRITVRADVVGRKVRFAVIDSGPGIAPEQMGQLFGRFWQAKPTDRRGIGLGLTIAKGIVEAHGEKIGVESMEGHGTEFWFTLPTMEDGRPGK